jgi:hypothetical protein
VNWDTTAKTTGFTAVSGVGYFCDTTSAGFTVTLPATPSAGDIVGLVDYAGTFDTNFLTIDPNGEDIEGSGTDQLLTGEREGVVLIYVDSTQGWLPISGINEGTDALSPNTIFSRFFSSSWRRSGGNRNYGGGGGAGGYRTSTQTVDVGTVITVTVGDGGAAQPIGNYATEQAASGSNSSISGSGLTTITSAGGGGGSQNLDGANGGSGGGASDTDFVGGSGNTPSTAPSQGNNGGNAFTGAGAPNYGCGGGGGSGAVGVNGTSTVAGNGGAGTASSITGTSITRAGGGGGGTYNGGTRGTGGTGGGGNAGTAGGGTGTSGTVNTGGGGGGSSSGAGYSQYTGGAGGKGVVILSMPDAKYTGTTTGSPTVATGVSGKTVLTFTGSGSYTA